MPVLQRSEQPIETTAIPGRITPTAPTVRAGPMKVVYVPGYRFILSGHRENYFISGASSSQNVVKFQYSAKFDLWPNATRHSVYMGFTQKSLWRLWDFDGSSPFIESNYAPEVFYGYYSKLGDVMPAPGTVTWFIDHVRAGLEHESNGRDGLASRGWNRVNASLRVGAYLGTDVYLSMTPRGWLRPFGVGDNSDITEYMGYGSLGLEGGYDPAVKEWWGGFSLTATGWKGANTDLSRHAIELSGQWRPGYEGKFVQWWKFTPYFYVQYYQGYGETLLQYNQSVSVVRFGFSFEDRVNWITLPKS